MFTFNGSYAGIVFIIVPAMIIVSMMVTHKEVFTKKIECIIRGLYILLLTYVSAVFVIHSYPYEFIINIVAGVLGLIGTIVSLIDKEGGILGECLILISMFVNIGLIFI